MRILTKTLLCAFLAIWANAAAMAEQNAAVFLRDPEHVREQIEHLYRLEQAFLACDDVRLTGHDLKKLDEAIAEFELSSGFAASDLESIYEQVEAAAADASGGFCAGMTDVSAEIRAISAAGRN